ncbi:MAG: hypothetical protein PVI86_03485 [Phycisphaerae bacterium]|jgi:hypothetical protein
MFLSRAKSIPVFIGVASVMFLATVSSVRAQPYTLTGTLTEYWHDYSGTTSGIMIDVGNGPEPTGDISFSMDCTAPPEEQTITFDFDALTCILHLDVVATFPLQQAMGLPPVNMTIDESGPLDDPGEVDLGDYILGLSASLSGGGTVEEGVFTGFTFANANNYNFKNFKTIEQGGAVGVAVVTQVLRNSSGCVQSNHTGTLTPPGEDPQPTNGFGVGTIQGFPGVLCPTVSEWGLVVVTLLLLSAGTVVLEHRRRVPTA